MEHVTQIQNKGDLTNLTVLELLETSKMLQSYIQTHDSDLTTDSKLDKNGRVFDKDVYTRNSQLLEWIIVEYFSRPVEEGIERKL